MKLVLIQNKDHQYLTKKMEFTGRLLDAAMFGSIHEAHEFLDAFDRVIAEDVEIVRYEGRFEEKYKVKRFTLS